MLLKILGKKRFSSKRISEISNPDEASKLAIEGLDQGYKLSEVSTKYGILRSSIRDHIEGKTKQRKIGSKIILTQKDKD